MTEYLPWAPEPESVPAPDVDPVEMVRSQIKSDN